MEPGCEEIEQIRLGDKNKMQELGIEGGGRNREETDEENLAAVLEGSTGPAPSRSCEF